MRTVNDAGASSFDQTGRKEGAGWDMGGGSSHLPRGLADPLEPLVEWLG